MSRRFVLDCSLAASWCVDDEIGDATEEILDGLGRGDSAIAPALWVWEINNALLEAERRGRLEAATRHEQLALLKTLPIEIEETAHRYAWADAVHLAKAHRLSVYDAAYLEMALRLGLALGTLDKDLRRAGEKSRVECLPGKLR